MTTPGRDGERLSAAARAVLNGQCDHAAEQFADCDFCVAAVTLAESVPAMLARCEALETALRAVQALREHYHEDDPKKACDECQDCGDIVMCRFHSLLSALEGRTFVDEFKVPTNLRALLSAEPPAPKEEQ